MKTKSIHLKISALTLLCTFGFSIRAVAETLTWQQAVARAADNNAEIQGAANSLRNVETQEMSARSGFLPSLSGNLGYSRGQGNDGGYSATLNLNQNLFAGFADWARTDIAKANTSAAQSGFQIAKARISYELKAAFQNLQYAKSNEKLTKEIVRRREENYRLVSLRFQNGNENKGSVLLSEASLNQARYDAVQADNQKRNSSAQLARALGLDEFSDLDITGDVPVVAPPAERPNLKAYALTTPEYRQSTAQQESAEAGVTAARSGFFPSLSVSGSVGEEGPTFYPDQTNRWSVGATLSIPIFTGLRDFASVRASSYSLQSAIFARSNLARQQLSNLEIRFSSYIEAVAKFKVDESFQNAAVVRAEIARKRYNNGLLTFDNWDIIENDLISRQKAYLASRRDRVLAEASWEQALGRGVFE